MAPKKVAKNPMAKAKAAEAKVRPPGSGDRAHGLQDPFPPHGSGAPFTAGLWARGSSRESGGAELGVRDAWSRSPFRARARWGIIAFERAPLPVPQSDPLYERRPKTFGIGQALPPKRDVRRFVKWPRYVRIQRQKRVLLQRLKVRARRQCACTRRGLSERWRARRACRVRLVALTERSGRPQVPPALFQFTRTLDKNAAQTLFGLLTKYRPEDKATKKARLQKEAEAKASGARAIAAGLGLRGGRRRPPPPWAAARRPRPRSCPPGVAQYLFLHRRRPPGRPPRSPSPWRSSSGSTT